MVRTLALVGLAVALAITGLAVSRSSDPQPTVPAPDALVAGTSPIVATEPGPGAQAPGSEEPAVCALPVDVKNGPLALKAKLSSTHVLAGESQTFVVAELRAKETGGVKRRPLDMAIVLDRSSSMAGRKLQEAKAAALAVVEQLGSADRLALVDYAADVRIQPLVPVTALNRSQLAAYVSSIEAGGYTNIGAALKGAGEATAAAASERNVRVVLISDGRPTAGMLSQADLLGEATRLRRQGASVTAIGVGADFDETLMHGLAEVGGGFYAFLEDIDGLSGILRKELNFAATTVARDVDVIFEAPAAAAVEHVYGYRFRREGSNAVVRLYDFAPGTSAKVLARFSVRAGLRRGSMAVARVRVCYADAERRVAVETDAKLAARVTDHLEEVLAHRDRDVAVFQRQATSSDEMARATEMFHRGDNSAGLKALENLRNLFAASANELGSAELRDNQRDMERTMERISRAQSDTELRLGIVGITNKKLKAYGSMGGN